jgi:hypothetical protein
MMVFYKDWYN